MGPLKGIRFGGFRYRINVFLTRIFAHGPFFSILRNISFANEILNTFILTCTFWFHDVSTRLIANCAIKKLNDCECERTVTKRKFARANSQRNEIPINHKMYSMQTSQHIMCKLCVHININVYVDSTHTHTNSLETLLYKHKQFVDVPKCLILGKVFGNGI